MWPQATSLQGVSFLEDTHGIVFSVSSWRTQFFLLSKRLGEMFRLIFINKVRTKTFTHQSPSAETYQIIQSFPHALVCPPRSTARVMREYAKIDLYIGLSKHSMDQSTNCVDDTFGKLATTVHMNQLLFVTKGLGQFSESCGKITASPNTSGTFKETRDVTTKILEFANTSTGWPSLAPKTKG